MAEYVEIGVITGEEQPERTPNRIANIGDNAHTGGTPGARQACELLRDMRRIYKGSPEADDKTVGQKICRQLLKEEPKKFLDKLQQLERDHKLGGKRESGSAAAKAEEATAASAANTADEGTVGVLELIDRLLGDNK